MARVVRTRLASPWILILSVAWSAGGLAAALKDVEFASLPGNQVRIDLVLSEAVAAPRDFSTDAPARIVLDPPGVTSELPRKNVAIDVGPVQSLTALDAEGRTRVVVNLASPVPYRVQSQGDRISISINESVVTSPLAVPVPVAPPSAASSTAKGPELRGIDFQRGPAGEGRVLVKLPRPNSRAIVEEKGGKVVVEVLDATLPERLRRRLDVVDFGTPVVAIESLTQGRDVAITIQPTKDFEYLAYQVNELFTIEFRTLSSERQEQRKRDQISYSGDQLNLNFQDIELRQVFYLLADFTGFNLVVSDSVKGNVTLRLKNVPWDQALDIILKAKGLSQRKRDNVIMIGPTKEITDGEKEEKKFQQIIAELEPLRTEYIQINYGSALDMVLMLDPEGPKSTTTVEREGQGQADAAGDVNLALQAQGNTNTTTKRVVELGAGKRMLSPRGSATADDRTNTLIVQDTQEKLAEIRALIARLDVPLRQVMIESRVVIATDNFARELGVRFGANRLQVNENKGNFNEIYGGRPGTLEGTDYWGTTIDGTVPLMVDLPAANPNSAINFLIGKIGSYLLQLELTAMQQEGRGEIISNPRVITSDKQKAEIEVGQQVPVVTPGTQNSPPTVTYQNATLKLDVTPQITPDNRILMGLSVTKNEADEALKVDGNPYINKRTVKTNVMVDNGETVVLGGVFERSRFTSKEQVPWLGNLPIVGNLFKNDARKETNNELLIFVTPRILQPELKSR